VNIRRAVSKDANELSQLAMRSKAYWPYPADYLEKCVEALRIDENYIQNWPVFVGESDQRSFGFFALKNIAGENRLDHLWIDPPFIKMGFGKSLFHRSVQEAQLLKWNSFRLAADPYALDFYLRLGGHQIGTVQSRIKPDLFLPHIEFKF
jgi:hypothetical protein